MKRGLVLLVLLCLIVVTGFAKTYVFEAIPETGLAKTILALEKLPVFGTVFMIGAHPDDEDNGLIAYLAKGLHLETYYLVSNWGQGGQNEIGPELYEALGVLRSQELASARAIDGGKQLCFNAYDFGFSKTAEETFNNPDWDKETIIGNLVELIRTYKPDIVLSRHAPTGGHGQHQACGVLVPEAVAAAADPNMYPEQLEAGLQVWQAKKLYQAGSGGVRVNTGEYDYVLGYSYNQIGRIARGSHQCQGMAGSLGTPGDAFSNYKLLSSTVGMEETGMFDNLDFSLKAISNGIAGDPEVISAIDGMLLELNGITSSILAGFNAMDPTGIGDEVLEGLSLVREIIAFAALSNLSDDNKELLVERLVMKEADFLAAAREVFSTKFLVSGNDSAIVPGQSFEVTATFWNLGKEVIDKAELALVLPEGWTVDKESEAFEAINFNTNGQAKFTVTVGADAAYTDAFDENPISAVAVWEVMDTSVWTESVADIRVVPKVSVSLDPERLMTTASSSAITRTINVKVQNNSKEAVSGTVDLELPAGWEIVTKDTSFSLGKENEAKSIQVEFKIPASAPLGESEIIAEAIVDGEVFNKGFQVIAYPHIETKNYYKSSVARVAVIDVEVASGLKVGYVDGGLDINTVYLRQMGVDVTELSPADLASGDLSKYDTIVIGMRAATTRPDIEANSARLNEYVFNGGNLLVQYHKTREYLGSWAPFDFTISSNRVTVEEAEIKILVPDHPIFNWPNVIGDSDWEGWKQERGLYFPSKWAPEFTPLIDTDDPGEDIPAGSLLIANYGKGTYIYTALVWYRQLDYLVPGGYRVFANMLSLPKVK